MRYTLAAGGLAVFLALLLLLTGMLEVFFYVPTPDQAAPSVQRITTLVPFGRLLRNAHYWSGQFLVLVAALHLLRVVLTGAYAPPRRANYLIGLGLFVLILLLDFTGYVLRWDEGIRWALVVGTNLLRTVPWLGEPLYTLVVGGSQPGAAALIRFYAWHIFGLTAAAAVLVVWHLFRLRRDGGIAAPATGGRITRFALLRREVLAMLFGAACLLVFALLVPAPTGRPIALGAMIPGDSRAPWFFLWIQELLKIGDPFWLGVLLPLAVMLLLGVLPYVLPNARPDEMGRWFPRGNRLAQAVTLVLIGAILLLTLLGALRGG